MLVLNVMSVWRFFDLALNLLVTLVFCLLLVSASNTQLVLYLMLVRLMLAWIVNSFWVLMLVFV